MDSERLSARTKQPGHDRTFERSERSFIDVASRVLDPLRYRVVDHPRDLANCFPSDLAGDRALGVVPEALIESVATGRKFFVEVKKQGDQGNAEERAFKHHTVQFYRTLYDIYGYDYHPFVTVCCESLAVNPRYTRKFQFLFEPDHYFLWVDYDEDLLADYLYGRCAAWLDDY